MIKYTFKRKEMKYLVSDEKKELLLKKIDNYLVDDEYGEYAISNLYCDTPDFRLVRNSIEKPVYKEKMRIRSYGRANSNDKVFIELKKKFEGIVYKRRISMKEMEAENYLGGEKHNDKQIEKEINYFLKFYGNIKPMMHLSYDRQAFSAKEDDSLRLTFDKNIRWRTSNLTLNSELYGNRLLPAGMSVMEIKCSNAMPLWLTSILADLKIYKQSFSKYGNAYKQKNKLEQLTTKNKINIKNNNTNQEVQKIA